ncbi:MAG: hydroxylamine oxidase, partial [Candidatus Zixiibacteriota bacterium]
MKQVLIIFLCLGLLLIYVLIAPAREDETPQYNYSEETQECLDCHKSYTPGIVEDWLKSRHAGTTPEMALTKPVLERRVSSDTIPQALQSVAVGCYECHSLN